MALIKCPECELQVSDKALTCPHCGYPLKTEKPFTPSRSTKHKRLPNGFGRITEIKNKNLRKRFRVMITVGRTAEGKPIGKLLKPNAYFSTYNEAYTALVEYNKNPYDLDDIVTMQELYDSWSKEFYKSASKGGVRAYVSSWNYAKPIHHMRILEVRAKHLKACIDNAKIERKGETIEATAGVKNRMKSLFNMMFDYALENDMVTRNHARSFTISTDILQEMEDERVHHIAFDGEEMQKLWDNVDNFSYIGYVLYQCYSGWRPTEIGLLRLADVHLDEGYIEGGIKTEAGRHRIVPIHPKIRSIVEREYKRATEMKSEWLFNYLDKTKNGNPRMTYNRYRLVFLSIVEALKLGPDHKPHDPRKTFITMAKKYKMDEYALKRIVGHDIDDITEAVYTERELDWYIEEMQKIK